MLEKAINDNCKMKIGDNYFLYKLDERLSWLFNLENGECYNLNNTSYFILSHLNGVRAIGEVKELYIQEYEDSDVDKTVLVKDFYQLIDKLLNDNVLITQNNYG